MSPAEESARASAGPASRCAASDAINTSLRIESASAVVSSARASWTVWPARVSSSARRSARSRELPRRSMSTPTGARSVPWYGTHVVYSRTHQAKLSGSLPTCSTTYSGSQRSRGASRTPSSSALRLFSSIATRSSGVSALAGTVPRADRMFPRSSHAPTPPARIRIATSPIRRRVMGRPVCLTQSPPAAAHPRGSCSTAPTSPPASGRP
jgi:hypothetical protein